tara:strand:+ start:85 stop:858 length:774 start_codon:yes stop_codon:yes gene_type:complete
MKILVACEESQAVTKYLRKLGHEAFSCDLLSCSGGHPEWHFQEDIMKVMHGWFDSNEVTINNHFDLKFDVWSDEQQYEYDGDYIKQVGWNWELMIAFPPCTHLASSGARHFAKKIADGRQQQGIDFFMELINAPIQRIAVENPIGVMSSKYRKPDQIIQPWMFGDKAQKSTCLWLKNLPKLTPTDIVDKGEFFEFISKKGEKKRMPMWYYKALQTAKTPEERSTLRSKTFEGIAHAMATQWTTDTKQLNLFKQNTTL